MYARLFRRQSSPSLRMLREALMNSLERRAERGPLRSMDTFPDQGAWLVDENGVGDVGHMSDVGLEFGTRHISTSNSEGRAIDEDAAQGWLPLPTLMRDRWDAFRPYSRTSDNVLSERDERSRATARYMNDIDRDNRNMERLQRGYQSAMARGDWENMQLFRDAIRMFYNTLKGRDPPENI